VSRRSTPLAKLIDKLEEPLERPPPCYHLTDLFYGPPGDGRSEKLREHREAQCRAICATCTHRIPCLERALVFQDSFGVWGGMSEGERKKFRRHLREEGYADGEIPKGSEFIASLRAYYNDYIERKMA
jgi:hypothetical protein